MVYNNKTSSEAWIECRPHDLTLHSTATQEAGGPGEVQGHPERESGTLGHTRNGSYIPPGNSDMFTCIDTSICMCVLDVCAFLVVNIVKV